MPRIVLPRVDSPQPLSPTSPKVSPGCTVKSTPSTALSQPVTRLGKPRVRGKCFFRPCTSRMASMFLLSGGRGDNAPNDREKPPEPAAGLADTPAERTHSGCENGSPGAARRDAV